MNPYFETKDPAEAVVLTFDFTLDLPTGVTLTGTPIPTVVLFSGVDANPPQILNGVPSIDSTNTKVLLPVSQGNDGCVYEITIRCPTTNAYLTLIFTALLPVAR